MIGQHVHFFYLFSEGGVAKPTDSSYYREFGVQHNQKKRFSVEKAVVDWNAEFNWAKVNIKTHFLLPSCMCVCVFHLGERNHRLRLDNLRSSSLVQDINITAEVRVRSSSGRQWTNFTKSAGNELFRKLIVQLIQFSFSCLSHFRSLFVADFVLYLAFSKYVLLDQFVWNESFRPTK